MNEKVRAFLDAQKEVEKKRHEEEKNKILFAAGLYEEVYVDESDDETFIEYDDRTQAQTYYKMVPIKVTDEEYEEIKKYSKKENTTEDNPIAMALRVIAWVVFIGGFITGIAFGMLEAKMGDYYTYTDTWFSFATALVYWSVALISGTMLHGFAEIINLLTDIKNK